MRLTPVQKGLWVVTGAVVAAWAVWMGIEAFDSHSGVATEVVEAEPFRPTFALPDADGRLVTSEDLRGRHILVFFGFTNCPDVCPTTLAEVAQVMDDLGPEAERVQPLFVSVDPERDRALGLAEYTQAFHPSILGLAGDEAQTRAAADSFKVFYGREDDPAAPGSYTMAHFPGLILVGPEGDFLDIYDYGTPAAEIAADLRSRL